jgi:hypothetical protein
MILIILSTYLIIELILPVMIGGIGPQFIKEDDFV